MNRVLFATLIGLAAGVLGTGLGGLLSLFTHLKEKRYISFVMEFSAGLMLSLVCLDLLPEAFELGGVATVGLGILLGVITIVALQNTSKFMLPAFVNPSIKTGLLLAAGIAIHNFPEGLAIGSSLDVSLHLGVSIALVIGLHNLPEGLALSLPLKAGGYKNRKIVLISIMAGIPMAFGACIGSYLGGVSDLTISLSLGFAGGAMLYIVCEDIIPESKQLHCGRFSTLGNILGIIAGIGVSLLSI